MIWCLFGYGVDDDDSLAIGGHYFAIVLVYLVILWFILLRLGREYKCIHSLSLNPYWGYLPVYTPKEGSISSLFFS